MPQSSPSACSACSEHDDPRYIATVHAVESSLRSGDTVYRYKHEDGLPGEEGGFNLMTSWLIDAKVQIGDLGSARELFRAYVDLAGPTGLITEEVDPATGRALGNHPQAYSHLGLISGTLHLAATPDRGAGRRARSARPTAGRGSPTCRER